MMAAVHDALLGVDLVCLIRDASVSTGNGDRFVLDLLKQSGKPAILLLNKTDKLPDKSKLLPLMEWYQAELDWRAIIPVSALKGDQIQPLLDELTENLPTAEKIFADDELTDQPLRALAAEIVREKILETTGEEIPRNGRKCAKILRELIALSLWNVSPKRKSLLAAGRSGSSKSARARVGILKSCWATAATSNYS